MALSKPTQILFDLTGAYFESLYNNPLKTKALTSCFIAVLGNLISQKVSKVKYINEDSLIAFGVFGFLIGGPLPHYFYLYVRKITKSPLGILLIERLLYTPCFQAISLYMLTRLESKPHCVAYGELKRLYMPVLLANLKYLTLLHYINIKYVPPMLQVLLVNLIGLGWSVYLTNQQSKYSKDRSVKK